MSKIEILSYYTYILQSEKDDSFYIGYTANLEQRLLKHNTSKSGYTARKKPWKLVYCEVFNSKTEAIKRELSLKKMKHKDLYKKLIEDFNYK